MAAPCRCAARSGTWRVMCLLGACVLLPYNSLLNTQSFIESSFSGLDFTLNSMIMYSLFLCSGQVLITFKGQAVALRTRMRLAFATAILACAGILGCGVLPGVFEFGGDPRTLCNATLAFVALLGASNALMQTAVLGTAGQAGPQFSAAVMVGLGVAGLLSFALSLATQALASMRYTDSQAKGVAGIALFEFCGLFMVLSYLVYRSGGDQWGPSAGVRGDAWEMDADCPPERLEQEIRGATGGSFRLGLAALREAAPQALNVFVVFAVTMTVFPGVTSRWKPIRGSAFTNSPQLFQTLLVGVFQVSDVLSRVAAEWGAKRIPPQRLWVLVWSRLLLLPVFLLGQIRPEASSLWGSDAGRLLLCAALAFTNGWFASLAMMFGPERATPELKETAGVAMSCVMCLGIFCGTLLALLTQSLV